MKKIATSLFLDRRELKKLLLECLLIVFSVLLALFINRTAENSKTRNQKRVALERIYKEVIKNYAVTQEWQARHQLYLDRTTRFVTNKNDSLRIRLLKKEYLDFDLITDGKGLTSNTMSSTAWDAAKSTQIISEFEYETVETLTRLYQSQQYALDVLNKLVAFYFDNSVFHDETHFQQTMIKLQLLFTELVIQEETLNEDRYQQALKVLQPYAHDD
jgi:hypothetical protein